MAFTLPTPIRVAAGLLGATKDKLSTLPQDLPVLAVSAAGQAFRMSLRLRQEIAELAVRGDDVLAGLTGGGAAERPEWAVFDEDTEPPAAEKTEKEDGSPNVGPEATAARARRAAAAAAAESESADADAESEGPVGIADPASPEAKMARAASESHRSPRSRGPRSAGAGRPGTRSTSSVPQAERRTRGAGHATMPHGDPVTAAAAAAAADAEPILDAAIGRVDDHLDPVPPVEHLTSPLAGTDSVLTGGLLALPVAGLKARIDTMPQPEVRALLAAEETGRRRAAYLTLLTNRLTTLAHDDQ